MAIIIFIIIVFAVIIAYLMGIGGTPVEPEQIYSAIEAAFFYINKGLDIMYVFIPETLVRLVVSVALTVKLFAFLYHFIMWIIRKLPIASE